MSGIEDLADRADVLSAAAQRGAAVTTRVGLALSLALVVAAAAYSMGRRRREVQLGAGTGRRPLSAGLLYAAELVPAAVLAGVVGWLAARGVVALTVGTSSPTRSVVRTAGLWSAGAVCAALVASVVVAAAANRLETRRLEGRPDVRLPWVLVLVVVAASATAGLLTRPPAASDTLGPLDLLVPPLVVAAVAAVGSRLAFAVLRRTRTATRPRAGARWWPGWRGVGCRRPTEAVRRPRPSPRPAWPCSPSPWRRSHRCTSPSRTAPLWPSVRCR